MAKKMVYTPAADDHAFNEWSVPVVRGQVTKDGMRLTLTDTQGQAVTRSPVPHDPDARPGTWRYVDVVETPEPMKVTPPEPATSESHEEPTKPEELAHEPAHEEPKSESHEEPTKP